MTRPTDEALEAMAVKLECDHWLDAADLLRACKGRVRVKALVWEGDGFWSAGPDEGWTEEANTPFGWGYSIEFGRDGNFTVCSTFDWSQDGFEVPDDAKAAAQADYERRILAALEPAPDHSEWNAAIEAAAKVAERRSTDGLSDDDPYNEGWRRCATITTAAIRNLKKGPDHE